MSSPQSFSGDRPSPAGQGPPAYPAYQPAGAVDGAITPPSDSTVQPYYSPDPPSVVPGTDASTPAGVPVAQEYAPPPTESVVAGQRPRRQSRIGAAWVALIVAAIVLIFLLVFVVQNPTAVQVRYFGFEGTLSLGVALLFAAIAGALTAGLLGTVRILQLRSRARRAAAGK